MKPHHKRRLAVALASLAICPFVVGFDANDSTGWNYGGGLSHTRAQYSTGCSPKYYSQRNSEFGAHLDYVQARNREKKWSPAKQVSLDVEGLVRTRTLLAEDRGDEASSSVYVLPEEERQDRTTIRPLLRIQGALAWKYLELSLGGLVAPGGGLGDAILPSEYASDEVHRGIGDYLLPTVGVKVAPVENFYVSANLLKGSTTLLSSGIMNLGLGFKTQQTDFWLGYALGVVEGQKVMLSLEQEWRGLTVLATASVLADIPAQNVGSLGPGDWADLGLALRVPLRLMPRR
jgi:hypothetical protein